MLRVQHLNCGCMCPLGGRLFDGVSHGPTARLLCHCLLVESNDGLVLVDTGFGLGDVERPYERLSPLFIHVNRIQFDRRETAAHQVEALGFRRSDVRHIVLTHLDFDHAGGLEDFPRATVHVLADEMQAARQRRSFLDRRRYRPQQWDEVGSWATYRRGEGERWFGFEAVRDLKGLPPEILFVPLPGHTLGHAGVAVETPEGWLFNAADAYFNRHEVDRPERECPPAARAYQRMMAVDPDLHYENQERVRKLAHERPDIRIFCSHDPVEFEALRRLSINEGRRRAPAQAGAPRSAVAAAPQRQ
ncbi:MAG TPA: MBL fold metallo-hydrolase [Beijerinckiaceae bacterium]|jgi:glyoxylase-like metal-dependent hydrolase (beta-lactamase superfamily II)